ncbi:MAG TPA: sodium:solute symporter family protein [Candidatus Polarisedimenticolia bacterium]|nr:sodium:solute symporter family protein [Candidatus Polarisedimenticolia bacterium]
MYLVLAVTIGFILLQLAIGVLASRRVSSEGDYLLAGRRLGYPLATFSIFATWFGAETCIGSAGAVHTEGLSAGSADPFGYAGCLIFMGLVFAGPLRRRGLTTLADLFRGRYSPGVERLAVLLMVPTSLLWAAAQVRAFGQVLSAASGLETALTITLAAAVVVIYTSFGGLMADAVTDLLQGIVIAAGLLILFAAVQLADVPGGGVSLAAVESSRLRLFGGEGRSLLDTLEAWMIPICGSIVAQELISRVLAARSVRVARRACLLGGSLYLLLGSIPVYVGLVGAQLLPDLENPETILPLAARRLLPPILYAVFVSALMSAILSTVDTTLLSCSALVAHNIAVPLRPQMSERSKLSLARGGVVAGGLIAYVLAMNAEGVYHLVEEASSFGSAGLFVILVFGLFTRIGGPASAAAALMAGVIAWLIGAYAAGWSRPFLASIGCALAAYLATAALARRKNNSSFLEM